MSVISAYLYPFFCKFNYMKPVKFIPLLIIFSITNTIAQDYQTVNSRRVAFFDNKEKNVESLRIDSLVSQADTILYPAYVIQSIVANNRSDCFSPYIASWIGKSVTIKKNGVNEFFNRNGEKIAINTKALINDKWIAFQTKELIIEATVSKHDTMTFLGIKDSVKTIGFQVYDKNKSPLNLHLNEMKLQLSKNHGFVKVFSFFLFPNLSNDHRLRFFEEYYLIGLSNPKIGFQNLTWLEVNDFQKDDELHIKHNNTNMNMGNIEKVILKYLERKEFKDSLVYRVERKKLITNISSLETTSTFIHDTITEIYKPDSSSFNRLPGEAIVGYFDLFALIMTNGNIISKSFPSLSIVFRKQNDTCWKELVLGGCFPHLNYLKGLGGPYYDNCNVPSSQNRTRSIVYSKKGLVTNGTPLVITGVTNSEIAENIGVYPNPATESVLIKFKNQSVPLHFEMSNIHGKLILNNKVDANDNSIDIKHLENGIYFYRLFLGDNIIKTGKLVKTNSSN